MKKNSGRISGSKIDQAVLTAIEINWNADLRDYNADCSDRDIAILFGLEEEHVLNVRQVNKGKSRSEICASVINLILLKKEEIYEFFQNHKIERSLRITAYTAKKIAEQSQIFVKKIESLRSHFDDSNDFSSAMRQDEIDFLLHHKEWIGPDMRNLRMEIIKLHRLHSWPIASIVKKYESIEHLLTKISYPPERILDIFDNEINYLQGFLSINAESIDIEVLEEFLAGEMSA